MHKRFRILLCAAVVALSGVFALLPKDAYAASFNASQLDPGVPLNALSHAQCRSNRFQVNFTFTTNSGNDIEVNAPWTNGEPTESEIQQSCIQAMNQVISQFGGAQISSDDGGYWDAALGQWQEFDLQPSDGQSGITDFLSVFSGMDYLPGCISNRSECELQFQSNLDIKAAGTLKLGPNASGISNFSQTGGTGGLGGGNKLSLTKFTVSPGATRLEVCVVASPSTCFSTDISDTVSQYAPEDSSSTDPADTEAPAPECNLGAMGWAICPLMNGMDSMLGGIYRWVEENFLQIPVGFYNTDSGTYEAWAIFRNIANILFVIFFLIVILSQVTSVGISNYGIKKMLPEIILAAILINLSFFIAQAMIDVSNIVGFQIKSLLEFIANSLSGGLGTMSPNSGFLAGLSSILIGAGTVIGAVAIGSVLMGGLGALFAAVLLFLLSALIGVLVLFLLLVVRQVGVIILVVLAPLAFAARILPNTANLFRTWWKMFVALLVVYPACSLVIGAGKLAGKIIVVATESVPETEMVAVIASIFGPNAGLFAAVAARTMYLIVAMIAMIAPYFAVISIIKSSLNGLGKLGGAITGKLDSAGKWGQNNINKAPGLRNLKNYADNSRALRTNAIKSKLDSANAAANAKKMADGQGGALRRGIAGTKLGKKLGISDKNLYGQMQDAEFQAAQAKDDAGMASLGQYQGERTSKEGKRLGKISDANAARLGVNPDGTPNGTKTFAPGSFEEHQQQAARTAVLQQEAKQSKQIDESYDAMLSPGDVMKDVYDSSGALKTTGNAAADNLRRERAIAALVKKGKFDDAKKLVQDYSASASYAGNKHSQQRLSTLLTGSDVKKSAANLYAYGKQVGADLGTGTAIGSYASMDGAGGAIEKIMQEKISAGDVASQDKDADWGKFSATQMRGALSSGASVDKTNTMNAVLATNATLAADVGKNLTAEQYGKLDDSTILEIANQALVANGYGGTAFTDMSTLNGYVGANPAAQGAMKGAFKGAFDQADPTKVAGTRAADHWSSDRRSILGL